MGQGEATRPTDHRSARPTWTTLAIVGLAAIALVWAVPLTLWWAWLAVAATFGIGDKANLVLGMTALVRAALPALCGVAAWRLAAGASRRSVRWVMALLGVVAGGALLLLVTVAPF